MDSRLRGNDGVMKIQSFYESVTYTLYTMSGEVFGFINELPPFVILKLRWNLTWVRSFPDDMFVT